MLYSETRTLQYSHQEKYVAEADGGISRTSVMSRGRVSVSPKAAAILYLIRRGTALNVLIAVDLAKESETKVFIPCLALQDYQALSHQSK